MSAHRRPSGSATVPVGDQTAADVLEERRRAWEARPLTREVYRRYFEAMLAERADGARTIEIGGGAGHLKAHAPGIVVSDLVATPYVDLVADALRLPFADGAVDNLLMLDVLHHLPNPARFFEEAARVLRAGGRLVMLEPYISWFSRLVFRLAHPEPVDLGIDPLPADGRPVLADAGPFASNQAIPTLVFFRHRPRFEALFPRLRVRTLRLDSVWAYPVSGGFSGRCLAPRFTHRLVWAVERALTPFLRWMAFRVLITLERA